MKNLYLGHAWTRGWEDALDGCCNPSYFGKAELARVYEAAQTACIAERGRHLRFAFDTTAQVDTFCGALREAGVPHRRAAKGFQVVIALCGSEDLYTAQALALGGRVMS